MARRQGERPAAVFYPLGYPTPYAAGDVAHQTRSDDVGDDSRQQAKDGGSNRTEAAHGRRQQKDGGSKRTEAVKGRTQEWREGTFRQWPRNPRLFRRPKSSGLSPHSGEFHDQVHAKWIVIRRVLCGHNDSPCEGPAPAGLSAAQALAARRP
jgi:hypothetical protein